MRAQHVDERPHDRGLAGPRTAGEDRQPVLDRALDGRPLRVGRHERPPHRTAQRAHLQRRRALEQRAHPLGQPRLGPVQRRPADQLGLDDDLAARGQLVDGVIGVRAQQSRRATGELGARQPAVPVALGLAQHVHHARAQARGRVGRRPERTRQRVGGREPDALELGDPVGVVGQHVDRLRAQRPRRAGGDRRGHAVRVQEEPHRAQRARLLPRRHRRADPRPADARHLEQPGARIGVDDLEHLGAPAVHQIAGAQPSHVLDRREHPEQRRLADRLAQAHDLGRELAPEALVLAPAAADLDGLALVDVAERPGHRHRLALVGHAREHGELPVRRAPPHPLDLDHQGFRHDRHPGDGRPRPGANRRPVTML